MENTVESIAPAAAGTRLWKIRSYERAKARASLALAVAALIFLIATWLEVAYAWRWLGWVRAFAEAAMVGGLADWFAVTALFHEIRVPFLRLSIPLITRHTALITREKHAIGENLADFICNHFLTKAEVRKQLESIGMADALSRHLAEPAGAQRLADAVIDFSPRLISLLDSPALQDFLRTATKEKLAALDLSSLLAKLLVGLTRDGRHQELVDHLLHEVANAASADTSRQAIAERMNIPLLKGTVAKRVSEALRDWLKSIAEDKDGKSRQELEGWISGLIGRLFVDKDLRERIHGWRDKMLANDALGGYLNGLWQAWMTWVSQDITKADSTIHAKVRGAAQDMGRRMQENAQLRSELDIWLMDFLSETVDKNRSKAGKIIASKISDWDDDQLVRELELAMGKELQAIRLNGTVVGGFLGLLLYGVVELVQHLSAVGVLH